LPKERRLPAVTEEAEKMAAAKRERLAAELRANLSRRKAQSRERSADAKPPGKDGAPP
jgi:hypothetical protein